MENGFRMYDIIEKKRDGRRLSKEEIQYFIDGFTAGEIPDYQASALLMAIYFQGMTTTETYQLTEAMKNSGDIIDLSMVRGVKVDKHSTGGVGDKTSLIAAPLACACGVSVAKMSGRGLGFTGGTIDKLESIPGVTTQLSPETFRQLINENGMAITGQMAQVAKADKLLYALRDVTATVDNISLVTASVMSKKLTSGSDAIVLDVKCGDGAFMKTFADAKEMAQLMVDMGNKAGKKTIAFITSMEQPLGNTIGNAVEVKEAIETLRGKGSADLTQLSVEIAGAMIYVADLAGNLAEGKAMAKEALDKKEGLVKFRQMITAQGGTGLVTEDLSLLPKAAFEKDVLSMESGFVSRIHTRQMGMASVHTGAGRMTKEETPDPAAGIVLQKKVGDSVSEGDCLAKVFGNSQETLENAALECQKAYVIEAEKPDSIPLILDVL